jgi:2-dehydro-3-deoxyphosphogluconate aldolase/(4S)-4-hydroxy-2-oxoglutarate aldolase
MQSKKDFFSEKLDLESFFLLIKPDNNIYYDNIKKRIIYGEIEKVISLGLKNLEISWSNNKNWLDFVYKIKLNFPTINLGSASILNKKSIDDSLSIGLKYSMMKSWDKDLFNYAKAKKHLLIPGIKNLKDLKEAIKLNCKIIKIYPITSKDTSIDLSHYKNIDFIAAGGLSVNDLKYYKSVGYKTIVIGDQAFKNNKLDPSIYGLLKEKSNQNG